MAEKRHARKESGVMTQGRREVKVGALLLSNDENNVIAENALSRVFLCSSSKFEVKVIRFRTKQ